MKVSREQAAENHDKIITVAADLFREHGFDGIGVADLMKEAGLTHGGFYGHFSGKEDLIVKAIEQASADSLKGWERLLEKSDKSPYKTIIDTYLSAKHRNRPGRGCLFAALGADSFRQPKKVQTAVTRSLKNLLAKLELVLPAAQSKKIKLTEAQRQTARRQQAITTFSTMVGALVLARASNDEALSNEILATVAGHLNRPEE